MKARKADATEAYDVFIDWVNCNEAEETGNKGRGGVNTSNIVVLFVLALSLRRGRDDELRFWWNAQGGKKHTILSAPVGAMGGYAKYRTLLTSHIGTLSSNAVSQHCGSTV